MESEVRSYRTGGQEVVLDLTRDAAAFVDGRGDGLLHVFVPHATAGLAILETGAGSDDDLLAALGDLLPVRRPLAAPARVARARPLARHAGPRAALLLRAGPRRTPRARHLAEHLPGGPQRRQRAARRAVLLPRGLIVVDLCRATPAERAASLPGDELVAADVVMDRGFSLAAAPGRGVAVAGAARQAACRVVPPGRGRALRAPLTPRAAPCGPGVARAPGGRRHPRLGRSGRDLHGRCDRGAAAAPLHLPPRAHRPHVVPAPVTGVRGHPRPPAVAARAGTPSAGSPRSAAGSSTP